MTSQEKSCLRNVAKHAIMLHFVDQEVDDNFNYLIICK